MSTRKDGTKSKKQTAHKSGKTIGKEGQVWLWELYPLNRLWCLALEHILCPVIYSHVRMHSVWAIMRGYALQWGLQWKESISPSRVILCKWKFLFSFLFWGEQIISFLYSQHFGIELHCKTYWPWNSFLGQRSGVCHFPSPLGEWLAWSVHRNALRRLVLRACH